MTMQAVRLMGFEGIQSLQVVNAERPKPGPTEVLLQVKAAGLNFAEAELIVGRYPAHQELPFIMGWEAAGVVVQVGERVTNLKVGDAITTIVSSGAYAEFATADAANAISIPTGISFAQAVSITLHGIAACALLRLAAKIQPAESILIQAAAGGVGVFLVQLAKLFGAAPVIALAGSPEKLELVSSLGADVAINYRESGWADQVRRATGGRGVDVVLEAATGEIGETSFTLAAPFGRIVVYGARNIHESFSPGRVRQLVSKNQTLVGFNLPALRPQQIHEVLPDLLNAIAAGKVKLLAGCVFPLTEVKAAFEALLSRRTVGKVVLVP
jgi:NADPH:quinone reductase